MPTAGSLFSGCGLLDYGLHLAGWEHAWFVERTPFRRAILEQRWPEAVVHDDVRTVDAVRLGRVDLLAGGFPCRGVSTAGKRTGLDHPETALWSEFARLIGELRPRLVLVENVANLLAIHNGAVWGTVLGDLATLGYAAWWDCLPAAAFGAPHLRDRVFLVAVADDREQRREASGNAGSPRHRRTEHGRSRQAPPPDASTARWPNRTARWGHDTRPNDILAAPDADRGGLRIEPEPQPGSSGQAVAGRDRFPWGAYDPAIRRWEAIHGPAPEPLVPRVADGSTRGVDGPRVSALGDGVLVHAAAYLGSILMTLHRELAAVQPVRVEETP